MTPEELVSQVFTYKYVCGSITLDKTVTMLNDGTKDVRYVVKREPYPFGMSASLSLSAAQWEDLATLCSEQTE